MNRDAFADLTIWKDSSTRRPLILRGARQVGKTWVIRQLGADFEHFLELNFEETPQFSQFFNRDLDPNRIVRELSAYLGEKIVPGKTLLFFDEIQIQPKAITALRYFFEKLPELHVIAAGSLLEFELEKISFPVGRVEFYYLYPMSFGEFLEAGGKTILREMIRSKAGISLPLHEQLNDLFRDYIVLGGMPAVLDHYIKNQNVETCRKIQTSIIETYLADFPKYAGKYQIKYLNTIFSNTPIQLGRKFKYSNVSNLYKSRELKEALDLLEKASLLHRVYHSSANGIPLTAEQDDRKFKVIFLDTGLALNLLNIPLKEFFGDYDISLINEGAIAEQIVGQELVSRSEKNRKSGLYYWHREAKSSNAEVDYLVTQGRNITPIEVKRGVKGRIRSLHIFLEEKKSGAGIVISNNPFSKEDNIHYVPFYGIENLLPVIQTI
jgi:uncharacterized protein